MAKIFVMLAMAAIFIALVSGGIFLVKDAGKSQRTLTALKWRIGLSLLLFVCLFFCYACGLIEPHALVA